MPRPSHVLDPDAQAILLLCGRLGSHNNGSAKPLTRNQYNEVANWLNNQGMRPGHLLDDDAQEKLSAFGDSGKLTEDRLQSLLKRGTALALAVEEWTNKGGWILARSDENYPSQFRKNLRHLAPPILYGVGDRDLLEENGISMVGSRNSDDASLAFVRDLARRCVQEGLAVVSGGARGVDQASMDAALEAGGIVLGALANGLAKTSRKKKYREAIADGRLTLISAYHPNSRFQVWKAMDRNKHIYALSRAAVVAHSAKGSGGTWAGATENLEHDWVPLFVNAEPPVPKGNQALIEMGGHPINRRVLQKDVELKAWFASSGPGDAPPTLFNASESPSDSAGEEEAAEPKADERTALPTGVPEGNTLFPLVWPAIRSFLHEPRGEQDVRDHFDDLHLGQARDWLMEAVERGLAVREERPVRYVLADEKAAADLDSESASSEGVPSLDET